MKNQINKCCNKAPNENISQGNWADAFLYQIECVNCGRKSSTVTFSYYGLDESTQKNKVIDAWNKPKRNANNKRSA